MFGLGTSRTSLRAVAEVLLNNSLSRQDVADHAGNLPAKPWVACYLKFEHSGVVCERVQLASQGQGLRQDPLGQARPASGLEGSDRLSLSCQYQILRWTVINFSGGAFSLLFHELHIFRVRNDASLQAVFHLLAAVLLPAWHS